MGACIMVQCPRCRKEFVASPSMLGQGYDYHCPYCDLYFPEEDSPRIVTGAWAGERGKWGA